MNVQRLLNIGLLMVSVAGIAVSAAHVVPYMKEEAQSASLYAELAAVHAAEDDSHADDLTAMPMATTPDSNADKVAQTNGEESLSNETPEPISPPIIHSGLLALHERNPDCVAWITIEGTVIDYPVMYHPSQKNYYLHRDFNGNHASAGALFIAEICVPDTSDNVIIYGHHMNSGKMFAALNRYKQQSFYEEHKRIVYETLNGAEVYEVIFAFTTPVYTGHDFQYYAFADAESAEDFNAYISACRSRVLYDTGMTAEYGDRLLTLSTCEYSQKNGRMVVVAKKIKE